MKDLPLRLIMRYMLVILLMVAIFLLSHESADSSQVRSDGIVELLQVIGLGGPTEVLSPIIRKTAHLTLYAILGGLLVWALAVYRSVTVKLVAVAVVVACVYAITDELHQALIPGRSGEVRDVLIDTAGAAVGASLIGWALIQRQKRFTTMAKSDTVGR